MSVSPPNRTLRPRPIPACARMILPGMITTSSPSESRFRRLPIESSNTQGAVEELTIVPCPVSSILFLVDLIRTKHHPARKCSRGECSTPDAGRFRHPVSIGVPNPSEAVDRRSSHKWRLLTRPVTVCGKGGLFGVLQEVSLRGVGWAGGGGNRGNRVSYLLHAQQKPHDLLKKTVGFAVVGATGFEPATPRPPVWCASQAALRPEEFRSIAERGGEAKWMVEDCFCPPPRDAASRRNSERCERTCL